MENRLYSALSLLFCVCGLLSTGFWLDLLSGRAWNWTKGELFYFILTQIPVIVFTALWAREFRDGREAERLDRQAYGSEPVDSRGALAAQTALGKLFLLAVFYALGVVLVLVVKS